MTEIDGITDRISKMIKRIDDLEDSVREYINTTRYQNDLYVREQHKTTLVRKGLEALISIESSKSLAALGGSQKKIRMPRRRRLER